MNFRKNGDLKIILVLSILTLLLIVIILGSGKKVFSNKNKSNGEFYSNIIGYSIPSIKFSDMGEEEHEKNILKKSLLNSLGIDDNYLSIIGKEIAYVKADENYKLQLNNSSKGLALHYPELDLNEFELSNDQVYMKENEVHINGDMDNAPSFNDELKKKAAVKPEVLIYHTHTCESYKPYANAYHSNADMNKNVAAVGEELKKELEKYGITTLHDVTIHDIESYDDSYSRSRETLQKYLKEYKDFKLVIDLHRDSIEDKDKVTTTINGEKVARFSFVMTKNHPNSDKNIKLSETLTETANKLYPGNKEKNINSFYKGAFHYQRGKKFYSQDLSPNAVLMEVGSQVNTLNEAKDSAKYLARIIAEYINGKN